jgi:rubrerythrin
MRKMTEKNLNDAFAGESMAHMKYLIFSEIAEESGYSNLARMFKAIAYAEQVHAKNHGENLGIIADTKDNIENCIQGETYEIEEMYPAFLSVAKLQEEKNAEKGFHYAIEAEKIHAEMYKKAKENVENDKDMEISEIYICPVCGYTHYKGDLPERCPVCGIPSSGFRKF